jgi:hypothetical protein
MVEVQQHGFAFQDWVKRTFVAPFGERYTDHWDVLASANALPHVPEVFRNLPISIKVKKQGAPLELGDALRQFDISQDFVMVAGFWRQVGGRKEFVEAAAAKFTAMQWRTLFHPLSRNDLLELDQTIKDRSLSYQEARTRAHALNHGSRFTEAKIALHPKIDSKTQRRLQCSLPAELFWKQVGREPDYRIGCSLWGIKVPTVTSAPRTFAKGAR